MVSAVSSLYSMIQHFLLPFFTEKKLTHLVLEKTVYQNVQHH